MLVVTALVAQVLCAPAVAQDANSARAPGQEPAQRFQPVADYSRFQRTLLAAQRSDASTRAEFAAVTLMELSAALRAEIDLVEGERAEGAAEGDSRAKLRGWAAAVARYLQELDLLLGDIEQGYEVRLSLGSGDQPEVWVDRRAIIATHPRPGHQALLEQAILAQFCAQRDCASLTAAARAGEVGDAGQPIPVSRGGVRPAWRFDATGPVCEHRELSVRFSAGSDLARNRALCEEFLLEAMRLVDEIAWQHRHDVKVDWRALSLTAFPGRTEHVVRLNEAGDSILLTLPIIRGTPGLLESLAPWLRGQVEGGQVRRLDLEAARLGWEAR
jgi:hypothetical protein